MIILADVADIEYYPIVSIFDYLNDTKHYTKGKYQWKSYHSHSLFHTLTQSLGWFSGFVKSLGVSDLGDPNWGHQNLITSD